MSPLTDEELARRMQIIAAVLRSLEPEPPVTIDVPQAAPEDSLEQQKSAYLQVLAERGAG